MASLADLFVKVQPDLSGFGPGLSRGLGQVPAERQGQAVARRFGAGFTPAVSGVAAGAAKGFAGAFAVIQGVKVFAGFIEEARESERIGRLTEAVIKSTGGSARITADQVGQLATTLSNKTGADDEAIQSGQNLLLTFTNVRNETGKGNDIFNQASAAVIDMTAALNGGKVTQEGVKTSSIQLGKALNDPIKGVGALSRVGVSFTAQQKEQIKTLVESGDVMGAQKIILGELGKEFGGAAAAAADPMQRLQVTVGNLREEIGARMLPIVNAGAAGINNFIAGLRGDGPIAGFAGKLNTLGLGLRAMVLAFKDGDVTSGGFVGAMERVGVAVRSAAGFVTGTVIPAFQRFGAFLFEHRAVVLTVVGAFAGFAVLTSVGASVVSFGAGIAAVGGRMLTAVSHVAQLTKGVGLLRAAVLLAGGPLTLIAAGIAAVGAGLVLAYTRSEPFRNFVNTLGGILRDRLLPALSSLGSAVSSVFAGRFSEAGGHLRQFVSGVGSTVSGLAGVIGPALLRAGQALVSWVGPRIGPAVAAVGQFIGRIVTWIIGTGLPTLARAALRLGEAIVGWVGPRVGPVLSALGGFIGSAASWIIGTGLPTLARAALRLGGALVGWVTQNVPRLVSDLGTFIGRGVAWIIGTGLPMLTSAAARLGSALLGWIGPKIPQLVSDLGQFLGRATGWIIGTGLPMLAGAAARLAGALLGWVLPKVPQLLVDLGTFIARAVGWVATTGVPKLVAGVVKLGAALIGWVLTQAPGLIRDMASLIGQLIRWVATTGVPTVVRGLLDMGKRAVTGFIDGFKQTDLGKAIGDRVESIRTAVTQKVTALVVAVSTKWTELRTATQERFDAIRTAIADRIEAARRVVVDKATAILTGARDRFSELLTAVRDRFEAIRAVIAERLEGARRAVADKAEQLRSAAVGKFSDLLTGARERFEAIRRAAAEKFEALRTAVTSRVEALRVGAERTFQTLWTAIRSGAAAANKFTVGTFLTMVERVLELGGRLPGPFGEQFRKMQGSVATFRSNFNAEMDKILDEDIRIKASYTLSEGTNQGQGGTKGMTISYRGGGPVTGPGGPTDDLVPAVGPRRAQYRLSNGEWISTAKAVDGVGGFRGMARLMDMAEKGSLRWLAQSRTPQLSLHSADPIGRAGGGAVRQFMTGPEARNASGLTRGPLDRSVTTVRDRAIAAARKAVAKAREAMIAGNIGGGRSGAYGGVKPHVAAVGDWFSRTFRSRGLQSIGGYSFRRIFGSSRLSDHATGHALDLMVRNRSAEPGNAMLRAAKANWAKFSVKYAIWRQRQYTSAGSAGTAMGDRGNDTQNHYDHVHLSFKGAGGRASTTGMSSPGGRGGIATGGGITPYGVARPRSYDQGGVLPPGLTMALNKTGRNETVIRPDGQVRLHPDDLRELARALSSRPTQVTVEMDRRVVGRAIAVEADRYARGG